LLNLLIKPFKTPRKSEIFRAQKTKVFLGVYQLSYWGLKQKIL